LRIQWVGEGLGLASVALRELGGGELTPESMRLVLLQWLLLATSRRARVPPGVCVVLGRLVGAALPPWRSCRGLPESLGSQLAATQVVVAWGPCVLRLASVVGHWARPGSLALRGVRDAWQRQGQDEGCHHDVRDVVGCCELQRYRHGVVVGCGFDEPMCAAASASSGAKGGACASVMRYSILRRPREHVWHGALRPQSTWGLLWRQRIQKVALWGMVLAACACVT